MFIGELELVTAPAVEPVSLADAKIYCRVDRDIEDSLIESFISSARRKVELHLGRSLINQTWRLNLDKWPSSGRVLLPKSPLQSISSISYYDPDGLQTVWPASNYTTGSVRRVGAIWKVPSADFPSLESGREQPISIEYVAGYGAAGSDIPDQFLTAIKMLVLSMYDLRGVAYTGSKPHDLSLNVDALLADDRIQVFE